MVRLLLLSLAPLLVLFSGCSSGPRPAVLTIGAASSLQPLLADAAPRFERSSGLELRISYGASGTIAKQIEQGAPIDVFVTAGTQYINTLGSLGFLREHSFSPFAYGVLVLVRPATRAAGTVAVAKAERIAIANPEVAPYGALAKAQLESVGLWETVMPNVVYAESASQAYQFAKAGEVDYALVPYPLVVAASEGVELVVDPALGSLNQQVTYGAVITEASEEVSSAHAFIEFLVNPENIRPVDFGYIRVRGPQ